MATSKSPAEHLELLLEAMEDTLLAETLIQLGYKEISPTTNPEWKQAFKADFEAKVKQFKSMNLLDLVREAGHKGIELLPSVTKPTVIDELTWYWLNAFEACMKKARTVLKESNKPAEPAKEYSPGSYSGLNTVNQPRPFHEFPGVPQLPWRAWHRMFETYLRVTNMAREGEDRIVDLLTYCLGVEGNRTLESMPGPKSTYAEIVEAFEAHYNPAVTT